MASALFAMGRLAVPDATKKDVKGTRKWQRQHGLYYLNPRYESGAEERLLDMLELVTELRRSDERPKQTGMPSLVAQREFLERVRLNIDALYGKRGPRLPPADGDGSPPRDRFLFSSFISVSGHMIGYKDEWLRWHDRSVQKTLPPLPDNVAVDWKKWQRQFQMPWQTAFREEADAAATMMTSRLREIGVTFGKKKCFEYWFSCALASAGAAAESRYILDFPDEPNIHEFRWNHPMSFLRGPILRKLLLVAGVQSPPFTPRRVLLSQFLRIAANEPGFVHADDSLRSLRPLTFDASTTSSFAPEKALPQAARQDRYEREGDEMVLERFFALLDMMLQLDQQRVRDWTVLEYLTRDPEVRDALINFNASDAQVDLVQYERRHRAVERQWIVDNERYMEEYREWRGSKYDQALAALRRERHDELERNPAESENITKRYDRLEQDERARRDADIEADRRRVEESMRDFADKERKILEARRREADAEMHRLTLVGEAPQDGLVVFKTNLDLYRSKVAQLKNLRDRLQRRLNAKELEEVVASLRERAEAVDVLYDFGHRIAAYLETKFEGIKESEPEIVPVGLPARVKQKVVEGGQALYAAGTQTAAALGHAAGAAAEAAQEAATAVKEQLVDAAVEVAEAVTHVTKTVVTAGGKALAAVGRGIRAFYWGLKGLFVKREETLAPETEVKTQEQEVSVPTVAPVPTVSAVKEAPQTKVKAEPAVVAPAKQPTKAPASAQAVTKPPALPAKKATAQSESKKPEISSLQRKVDAFRPISVRRDELDKRIQDIVPQVYHRLKESGEVLDAVYERGNRAFPHEAEQLFIDLLLERGCGFALQAKQMPEWLTRAACAALQIPVRDTVGTTNILEAERVLLDAFTNMMMDPEFWVMWLWHDDFSTIETPTFEVYRERLLRRYT